MKSKTVVFIHGMCVTPLCWEQWVDYYQANSYECIAPAWPGRDKPIDTLRKNHPDAQLGTLTLAEVVEHHANIIGNLDQAPILVGHSLGGLIVQILLQRGLAVAGIAMNSSPPLGVFLLKWSLVKANWPIINPFISRREPSYLMSFEHFQYTFVHTLPEAEQRAAYERFIVPESRLIAPGPSSDSARINFKRPRPPLLLIAGSEDRATPVGLNRANYEKYKVSASVTTFKEFAGRTHFMIWQENWEEVADYVISWLRKQGV